MKLKEGDAVEVLRSDFCAAWFPAKIVSVDKHKVLVRFDYKQHKIERVCVEDVRPCPPPPGKKKRWALGDIAEVFDSHCWRAAKIVKVLHDSRYVVKVFSSIQLKEFHCSSLRVRLDWHNTEWIGKDSENKHMNFKAAYGCEDAHQVGFHCPKLEEKDFGGFPPVGPLKRNNTSVDVSGVDAVEASTKRRKSTLERRRLWFSERGLPKQVTEEGNECSIASCGSNHVLESTVRDSRLSSRAIPQRSFNDASSSCRAKPVKAAPNNGEEDFAINIHKLELQAYQSTMQAFYASGPLSWEQESLLTNLRLSLNISNEEHLVHLRHLLSAPVL